MQRRNFLSNSGMLIPALLAMPSLLNGNPKPRNIKLLMIQSEAINNNDYSILAKNAMGDAMYEMNCKEVKHLRFTGGNFCLLTMDGRLFHTSKIVFNTPFKIDVHKNAITISTVHEDFRINYDMAQSSAELWSIGQGSLSAEKLQMFLKRQRSTILCVS